MEAIEQAIRNALAKADAQNPAIRQKIYESAWNAHERSLAANGALDDSQRDQRRERLKSAITRIEGEARAVAPSHGAEPRDPILHAEASVDPAAQPSLGSGIAPDLGVPEPVSPEPLTADRRPEYSKKSDRRARRRSTERKKASGLTKLLIGLALLIAALVLLWMVASGIINSKPSSVPPSTGNPALSGSHEPLKEGQLPSEGTWIAIFDPSDTAQVSISGRATASVAGDQVQKFLSIKSPGDADEISFQVGEGVLK
ncbi:MAG: hypothetical protein ACRECY_13660, partial [Phyllobacterium sp.]